MKDFITSYQVVTLPEGGVDVALQEKLVGYKRSKQGDTALIAAAEAPGAGLPCRAADLEDIMIHMERVAE